MKVNTKFFAKNGEEKGIVELPENIFGQVINEATIYYTVKKILACKRQGTANTKTRGEVRGGGRKPWRQKGTGRSRVGSIRSPLWKGGGVTFGPKMRDYSYDLPKKVKRKALISAFSQKAKDGKIFLIENLSLEEPKTKVVAQVLKNMGIYGSKILLLYDGKDKNLFKSSRNINNLTIIEAYKTNPYLILKNKYILMTEDGLKQLEGVIS